MNKREKNGIKNAMIPLSQKCTFLSIVVRYFPETKHSRPVLRVINKSGILKKLLKITMHIIAIFALLIVLNDAAL